MTPAELTVASIVHALQDYAAFPPSVIEAAAPPPTVSTTQAVVSEVSNTSAATSVHKGMSTDDVVRLAGKPIGSKSNGQLTTNQYKWQGGTLEGDFFNGVLVAYRISSS